MICYDPQPYGESSSGIDPVGLTPECNVPLQSQSQGQMKSPIDAEQLKQQAIQKRDEVTRAVKSRASQYFDQQKNMLADTLEDLVSSSRSCVSDLRQKNHPQLSEYTGALVNQVSNFCQNLRQKDASYFMDRTQTLARQHPGLFLGGALALGFIAVRFLKSSSQAQQIGQEDIGVQSGQEFTSTGIHEDLTIGPGTQYTV